MSLCSFSFVRGLGDVRETPRNLAFCAHAILSTQDIMVVNDATADPRFKNNVLVTNAPYIRFYAGAPLTCPEGYKLGTLCIIDTKTRPSGLSLTEKQNLRELAALVIEKMVHRKQEREKLAEDKRQIIACTAHDLLTPLTGIQLNLSLLMDDNLSQNDLTEYQLELVQTAASCSEVMSRICHQTIQTFRGNVTNTQRKQWNTEKQNSQHSEGHDGIEIGIEEKDSDHQECDKNNGKLEEGSVVIARLIDNLQQVIEPYPKKVPLSMEVDDDVPPVIISDDLKIFRSALNFLTNACKQTETGGISLHIHIDRSARQELDQGHEDIPRDVIPGDKLVFECRDTGPGVNVEDYPYLFTLSGSPVAPSSKGIDGNQYLHTHHSLMANSGLGLYSVASNISSVGGEYGFRPR